MELNLTKVQMLANALRGTVLDDQGYRGVIHVPERNEFIRYHAAYGVHIVTRKVKTWRVVRTVLAPDEVEPFLQEAGQMPKLEPQAQPLETLEKLTSGRIIQRFQAGGGILEWSNDTGRSLFIRLTNIQGLDVVVKAVTKWRSIKHIASRNDALRDLAEGRLPAALTDLLWPQAVATTQVTKEAV